ncbi:MAG: hypothetical protein WAL48_24895 [Xanthobacteraceae bacterium]
MKAGHDVEVYEQAPQLSEVGAGIQISANAMHVLRDLGLEGAAGEHRACDRLFGRHGAKSRDEPRVG